MKDAHFAKDLQGRYDDDIDFDEHDTFAAGVNDEQVQPSPSIDDEVEEFVHDQVRCPCRWIHLQVQKLRMMDY